MTRTPPRRLPETANLSFEEEPSNRSWRPACVRRVRVEAKSGRLNGRALERPVPRGRRVLGRRGGVRGTAVIGPNRRGVSQDARPREAATPLAGGRACAANARGAGGGARRAIRGGLRRRAVRPSRGREPSARTPKDCRILCRAGTDRGVGGGPLEFPRDLDARRARRPDHAEAGACGLARDSRTPFAGRASRWRRARRPEGLALSESASECPSPMGRRPVRRRSRWASVWSWESVSG